MTDGGATGDRRGLRSRLSPNSAASLATAARDRRWKQFNERFPSLEDMTVVDLGGYWWNWSDRQPQPRRVVVVNLDEQDGIHRPGIESVRGDACDLPATLAAERFDVVYSNSLIEHVGGYARRLDFARSVNTLADRHWVQTPSKWFPLEPHWLFPGMQFLPLRLRAAVARRWTHGHVHVEDRRAAMSEVLHVELLTATEMRHLFPQSELLVERFAGLPKSLIAVRS